MNIDFLAMVYMVVFLIMSFPASYIIDTYGVKAGLFIGSILLGIFSILKAVFAQSFTGVVIAQIGLAIAQPFILNAVTAVTARWFPLSERAMAAGLLALAQYLGIIVAMLVTPMLVGSKPDLADYGTGFEKMLWIYGIISLAASVLFLVFMKERPERCTSMNRKKGSLFQGHQAHCIETGYDYHTVSFPHWIGNF